MALKCKKSLNLIKCLSSINWGADREVLLKLYESLILSKMDYGCTIYSAARKSHLIVLDRIQNTALRLATGAFRTSPAASLCCESGIPPLKYRRQRFLLNYGIGIRAQPNHPNYDTLFNAQLEVFQLRPTITRPVGIRIQELLNNLDEELPATYELTYCEIPPWKITPPTIHFECAVYKKGETCNTIYLSTFHEIKNNYPDCQIIYTDGSKTDQGVGSAFAILDKTYYWSLNPKASIYTAELYAIWQALRYIEYEENNTFLICCDSLSVLESISNSFSYNPLVQHILSLTQWLKDQEKVIYFAWIPGHIGIPGNELADSAARQAAESENESWENIPLLPDDVKTALRLRINDTWQNEWRITESKLKITKPLVGKEKIHKGFTRREQVALTRLRIGHTNLTSIHMLRGARQPTCLTCESPLTINHIIVECAEYSNVRLQLQLPNNLAECLSHNKESMLKLIQYLKSTGLFKKL